MKTYCGRSAIRRDVRDIAVLSKALVTRIFHSLPSIVNFSDYFFSQILKRKLEWWEWRKLKILHEHTQFGVFF